MWIRVEAVLFLARHDDQMLKDIVDRSHQFDIVADVKRGIHLWHAFNDIAMDMQKFVRHRVRVYRIPIFHRNESSKLIDQRGV